MEEKKWVIKIVFFFFSSQHKRLRNLHPNKAHHQRQNLFLALARNHL